MHKKLTYISLFSNAGIGCYGFKQAGFECIATNEILPNRLAIQKYNNKCKYASGYISGDIKLESIKKKIFHEINLWKDKESIKDVDVIIATPPCQGMSVANHKKKNELQRNSLITESINLIKNINPKTFILENVRTFLNTICYDSDGTLKPIKKAIEQNLANYNILNSVIDFKSYGNPSQRTRTLVIGVRKDLYDVTPYDLFPDKEKETTLRKTIGHFKSLKEIGEIDPEDIYHNFRPYPPHMLDWIKDLAEGQSAFDNKEIKKKPHQIINDKIVVNQHKNGDKYRRCFWDKPGYCVHTRNDQLASQMTIHPRDNRVFSIRELMVLMSIPHEFKWTNIDYEQLNAMTCGEKRKFLKREELNIRRTIGESIPPIVLRKIAKKIKNILNSEFISDVVVKKIIVANKLDKFDNLYKFINSNLFKYSYQELSKISELSNSKRLHNAAYYTSQDICFSIIKDLPDFKKEKIIRILEPSVGLGNFIPLLIKKYNDNKKVFIDVVDIDSKSLKLLKLLFRKINIPKNFKINYFNTDFLLQKPITNYKYDIVIGNPPFKKIMKNKELLQAYKQNSFNKDTNNIFSFFIEKAITIGEFIALIVPKSLLSTPEFNKTREQIAKYNIEKICDYGENAFKIKIETISFIINTNAKAKRTQHDMIKVESYITNKVIYFPQGYICDKKYPYWLIYRNNYFDNVSKELVFNIFATFRDRQITNKFLHKKGRYRVLKSRNIGNLKIVRRKEHDKYIDKIDHLNIKKILNRKNLVLIPNLTYLPRACFLPKESITDGSVAIAIPKEKHNVTKYDLGYYSSNEFREFYRLARNLSTRTMNIDSNSIFFFGKLKGN